MGDKPKLMELKELKPAQQQDVADFLQLVGYSLQNGLLLQEEQRLFSAAHLLISAVAGMSQMEQLATFPFRSFPGVEFKCFPFR